MTLGGTVWTLEGITFHHSPNVRDAHGVQWILREEQGFRGTPGTGATLSSRLNKHGSYRSPGWKKERTVTITGRCYGEYEPLRQAEANVCGLLSDPNTPGKLTCFSEIGTLELEVYLDDAITCAPLDIVSEPGLEFSIQMVAPDPRKYSVESQTESTGLPLDNGDGLDFTQIVPPETDAGLFFGFGLPGDGLIFGTTTPGVMILSNVGTAPTTPIYTLYGPLTNPMLTAGGKSVKYNGTLIAGEFLVIDPEAPSVLLGGTATRRHLVYPAHFDALTIPDAIDGVPGVLNVGLSHSGLVTATGWVEANYRAAWF